MKKSIAGTIITVALLLSGACAKPTLPAPASSASPATPTPVVSPATPPSAPTQSVNSAAVPSTGVGAQQPTPAAKPTQPSTSTPGSTSAATGIYSNMRISPPVTSGTKVTGTVTVNVTNPGPAGTFQVRLEYCGDNDECPLFGDDIQYVPIPSGASVDVTFPINLDKEFASRFTLKIGQLTGLLVK